MKWFKYFKINGEDREFMYLYGVETKQEIQDFLNRFRQHFNKSDLYKITQWKVKGKVKGFELWDARA